jgi:hypothetical protein
MKPGDLVEYVVEGEKISNDRRRFYLTLWCESFEDEFLVWWCIPITMKYNNITWINAQTLVKINDI